MLAKRGSVLKDPVEKYTTHRGDFKMSDNKKYLNDLKKELTQYKKKLAEAEGSFKGKANKESDKIVKSLKEIVEEAGQAYQKLETASAAEWAPMKKIASQTFDDVKHTFEDLLETTSDHINGYAHQLEEYSEEALESSIEYIKANPFRSILLAGGVGFVVGRILK